MEIMIGLMLGLILFVAGCLGAIFYIVLRMIRNDDWDDSNIINGIRLLAHVTMHTEDFGKMFYLTDDQRKVLEDNGHNVSDQRPFWYVTKDEFEGVVKTRP